MEVLVPGTKNEHRCAPVPVVTDEQRALLAYVKKYAQGKGDRLFGPGLSTLWKNLTAACATSKIPHVSAHDIRRSCGQWLIDLGVPLEIVSRVLRHADTKSTESIYARARDEDVADRILARVDPRYATVAHKSRAQRRPVDTLTVIPAPQPTTTTCEVGGVARTLTQWAAESGTPGPTLHHRLAKGPTMAEALDRGRAAYATGAAVHRAGKGVARAAAAVLALEPANDTEKAAAPCRTRAAVSMDAGGQKWTRAAVPEGRDPRNSRSFGGSAGT